ncbi:MAG: phenylalanine--tRNA ligase subunit beta [Clostridium sp.]|nr:phenylalanine--tRNA ligase subunit beta [Clostridium sp.]
MKISLEWLNEYVDLTDVTPEQIAHELTMSGLEVEEIEKTGPKFSNIRVAQIKLIDQHPNADKLHLVTVDLGTETKTVVCGAQNIKEGQIIPYASVGSKVLDRKTGDQFELTPAKIRGVESQGMLCSQDELGLENMQEEDGILILNRLYENLKLGEALEKVLDIKEDIVFDVAPTANRGDEMSIIGVARELSAIFNKKLNFSPLQNTQDTSTDKFKVEILDEEGCKYYSLGLLKDVVIKPSPEWMQRRLMACGIRAINNVVDITNYVLLEYGCPLHAFDKDKLNGYLCVRRAFEGETIVTLDEVERKTNNDTVLIATKEQSVCIGGVFGSANSEVDNNTKNIALEAAYFTPAQNRRSARSVGYRSEASARFERGIDIEMVKPALLRAMQLMVDLAEAKVDGIVETGNNKLPEIDITLRFGQIKRILGTEIPAEKCIEILENLGFELLGKNEIAAKFKVPSFRMVDVYREIDLIEEISRIYGFDKIDPTLPKNTQSPEIREENKILKNINNMFLGNGFLEAVTSSLVGEPLYKEFCVKFDDSKAVKVCNPQSEDHTMLRQSLMPSILNVVKNNISNGQKNLWIYEMGRTYFHDHEASEKDSGVTEKRTLAGAVTGNINNEKWTQKSKLSEPDFYVVKGMVQNLISLLGLENRIQFRPCESGTKEFLHPGKCAKLVMLGKQPVEVGFLGEVHPILKDKQKFQQNVYLFEIDLETLLQAVHHSTVRYKKLSLFPEVQRDLAFIVPEAVSHEDIAKVIKKSVKSNLFNGEELFDIYQGEHIKEGYKSMAFRIKMQDSEATLTDEAVEEQMNSIRNNLKKSFTELSFRE